MIQRLLLSILILALTSCARVQTLNLEKHKYSERPHNIIWFQVAGFSEEHIPLLRFNVHETSYTTSLEKVDCLGKMWNFNLYELRPDSTRSFTSQLNGSKNIKGQCSDFDSKPVWSYLAEMGYATSIIENGASAEQSIDKAFACSGDNQFKGKDFRFYHMGPDVTAGAKTFHYQNPAASLHEVMAPNIYYDKSCQKGICYSSLSNNFKVLWEQLLKEQGQTFFLVRDFNFMKGLKKHDISYAKESLQEIEKTIGWIKAQNRDDILIIVTGAESLNLEFPREGKEWGEFERQGKNIIYRNSALMSPVLAAGPMAENFCGLYDESEMVKRVLYRPVRKQFDWDVFNPFSNL